MKRLASWPKLKLRLRHSKKRNSMKRRCKTNSMSKKERDRRRQPGCKPSEMPKNSRKRKSNLKKMNDVVRLKSKKIRSRCS